MFDYYQNELDGRPFYAEKMTLAPGETGTITFDGLAGSIQIFIQDTGVAAYMLKATNDLIANVDDETAEYIDYEDDDITENSDYVVERNVGAIQIINRATSTDDIIVVARAS